jgi:hypothetical protein
MELLIDTILTKWSADSVETFESGVINIHIEIQIAMD